MKKMHLLFFCWLLLSACARRSPERVAMVPAPTEAVARIPTPTRPVAATATGRPVIADTPGAATPAFKRITIPYWLSLSHPAEWFPITGGNEGVLGFSTHKIALNPDELPEDGALFFVFYVEPDAPDPLQSVRAFAETLVSGTEILAPPESTSGVGQSAASMTYSWPGAGGRTFISDVTHVMDGAGRIAALWATSDEKARQAFATTFARIRDSLAFEAMRPAPTVAERPYPGNGRVTFQSAPLRLALSYPESWLPFEEPNQLILSPPAAWRKGRFDMFLVLGPPEIPDDATAAGSRLEAIKQALLPGAAPVSPLALRSVDEQEMALRYYATVYEQEPLLVLLASITRGADSIVAISYLKEEGYLDEMEAIANSIVIDPELQEIRANFTADWSPDGRYLAYTSRGSELASIYIFDLRAGTTRRLTDKAESAGYADWSPDGSQIVYNIILKSGRHLVLRDAAGRGPRQLTNEPGTEDSYPDWSPDGTRIVFARYDHVAVEGADVDAEIMMLDLDEQVRVRSLGVRGTSPAFSPDGSRIAFVSDLDGTQEIYVMDTDGSNIVRVTNDGHTDLWPAWSPDGERLVYVSELDGNFDLYVVNVDGSGRQRLTDHPAPDYAPVWSPDGASIAFDSNRSGVLSIYIIDADGRNVMPMAVRQEVP